MREWIEKAQAQLLAAEAAGTLTSLEIELEDDHVAFVEQIAEQYGVSENVVINAAILRALEQHDTVP